VQRSINPLSSHSIGPIGILKMILFSEMHCTLLNKFFIGLNSIMNIIKVTKKKEFKDMHEN
jgi:hypothetical protein